MPDIKQNLTVIAERHVTRETRALFRRSVVAGGLRLNHSACELLSAVVLARMMTLEGFGTYSSVYALCAALAIAMACGIPVALVRLVPGFAQLRQHDLLTGCIRWSYHHVAAASILVVAVSVAACAVGPLHSQVFSTYLAGFLLLPLMVASSVQRGALQSFENVNIAYTPELAVRPILFLLLLLAGERAFFSQGISGEEAMTLQGLAWAAAALVGAAALARYRQDLPVGEAPKVRRKRWYSLSLPMVSGQISAVLMAQAAIMLLPAFVTSSEVALYRAAFVVATLVALPLIIVNAPLPPAIARLYHAQKLEDLQRLVTASARSSLAVAATLAIIVVLWGEWLISAAFGPEYSSSYSLALIMIAGQLINVGAGSVAIILQMTGHERIAACSGWLAVLLQVGSVVVLAPMFGTMGAAIAFGGSVALLNCFLALAVYKRLNIDPTFAGFKR